MGKPKTLSKKAKKMARKKGLKVKGDDSEQQGDMNKYTIDEILDKATEYMEVYNYEMAQMFCQRALEMDNDNVRALETTASLLLEAGDVESAKQCLGRAVTVAPETGHTKFLSLAQLFDGSQSLQLYKSAIEIIGKTREQKENSDDAVDDEGKSKSASLRRELSSAYCAVAELYMTDLCDEPEAETECTSSISNAVEADTSNPEAWQTKARLHLIKGEFEDARSSIRESLGLWLPTYMDVLENKQGATTAAFDPVEVCPLIFTTRISTVKILIELEDWENATKVLDGLVEEDEDVVEPWYLLGWLNKLRADFESNSDQQTDGTADGYKGNARFYLTKAKKVNSKNPTDDQELVKHIDEILSELGGLAEDDDDNEGEWEDLKEESSDEEELME